MTWPASSPAVKAGGPAGQPIADPRALLGGWTLRRRLRDRTAGLHGQVTGRLVLDADGDAIRWRESGTLRIPGHEMPVSREYRLAREPDGWWLLFPDGRPFHRWEPERIVEHPCVADLYRGVVRVDGPDDWRMIWNVDGPQKEQRIVSRFRRIAGAPGRPGGTVSAAGR